MVLRLQEALGPLAGDLVDAVDEQDPSLSGLRFLRSADDDAGFHRGVVEEPGAEAEDDFDGLYTIEQKHALRDSLVFLMAAYPDAVLCGHRDLSPDGDGDGKIEKHEWLKSCPGFDVKHWCKLAGLGG
jgi:hypothetical protein